MKSYKDLWNEEHERIYETLVDAGCPEDIARELADEHAGEKALDRYTAMADSRP